MNKFEVFAGPCVLESENLAMDIAGHLKEKLAPLEDKVDFYFKGSFDKANRTSGDSFRGPGLEEGLKIFEKIKSAYNVKVITDFHLPEQADEVASVVDVMQIPAFLCRQTDIILAGANAAKKNNRILKIKKGQFISPEQTENIVKKAESILSKDNIRLTERGTCFGYNNLIVDMASFQIMKSFGVRTVYDATHSVQRPGGLGTATGGKREQIVTLAKSAIAAGADGIFMECHPEPEKAKSDASTCLELGKIEGILTDLLKIHEVVR